MKTSYLCVFLAVLGFVGGVSTFSTLNGCATVKENSAVVELLVSQAAIRYIEAEKPSNRVARAIEVIQYVELLDRFASDEAVTIDTLTSLAMQNLSPNLSVADRQLALSVINIGSNELRKRIGEGILSPDDRVSVRGVLAAISTGAEIFVAR